MPNQWNSRVWTCPFFVRLFTTRFSLSKPFLLAMATCKDASLPVDKVTDESLMLVLSNEQQDLNLHAQTGLPLVSPRHLQMCACMTFVTCARAAINKSCDGNVHQDQAEGCVT